VRYHFPAKNTAADTLMHRSTQRTVEKQQIERQEAKEVRMSIIIMIVTIVVAEDMEIGPKKEYRNMNEQRRA
jgi:hypothetical protein